jgi:hypothetical protein
MFVWQGRVDSITGNNCCAIFTEGRPKKRAARLLCADARRYLLADKLARCDASDEAGKCL